LAASSRRRSRRRVRAALLVALGAVCYANALANDLVWDDRLTAAAPVVTQRTGAYFRPLVMASFAVDRALWHGAPAGFHLTNVVAHLAVAWLVGTLADALGLGPGVALASTLVFAAHPVQTEAVTYVSGRTDVFCALFVLLGALAWRRAAGAADRFAVASAAAMAAAVLSKEAAIAMPLALLVPGAHPAVRPPRPVLPLAVGSAGLLGWTLAAHPGIGLAGLLGRLPAIAVAALTYLRLLVWPADLHLERFTAVSGWPLATVAVWVPILALLVAAARRMRGGWFLLALAALAYGPVSGVVPVYPAIADRALFTPEHFLYLPLVGLVPLVAGALAPLLPRRPAAIALALVLAVWTPIVIRRNRDWRDDETLFRQTLRYDPPAARVWFNLGNLSLAAGRLDEAERLYREALAREPHDAATHLNLGIVFQRERKLADAEEQYRDAIAANPQLRDAYRGLAALLAARGEDAAAARVLDHVR